MDEVLFTKQNNGLGIITLNRPHTLNALSYNMIQLMREKLQEWDQDEEILLVILEGEGDRAFCAGGDIKEVYEGKQAPEKNKYIDKFLEDEYKLDQVIYHFTKPIVVNMDGIVMGGGVGLTYGASHRIVTENTRWAMPEVNIGFFPDVGAAYFLNQAPDYLGRYLALTANSITSKDVIYIKAADALIPSTNIQDFFTEIKNINWHEVTVTDTVNKLITKFDKQTEYDTKINQLTSEINEHFQYKTIEEILNSLHNSDSTFAKETREIMQTKSPFSLKLTLKHLIESSNFSIDQCLEMDTIIASHFLKHDDFYEGIRSVLIDRDQDPQYKYKTLDDVDAQLINSFFT